MARLYELTTGVVVVLRQVFVGSDLKSNFPCVVGSAWGQLQIVVLCCVGFPFPCLCWFLVVVCVYTHVNL